MGRRALRLVALATATAAMTAVFLLYPPTVRAESQHALFGSIIDELTGAGMPGVTVTLYSGMSAVGSVVTDDAGYYRFEMEGLGFYKISARKSGYNPVGNVQVFVNGETRKDLEMMPTTTPSITAPYSVCAHAGEAVAFELESESSVYDTEIRLEVPGAWRADNILIDGAQLSFDGHKLTGVVAPAFSAEFSRCGPDSYTLEFQLVDTATGTVLDSAETIASVSGTEFLEPQVCISGLPDVIYTDTDTDFSIETVEGSVYYSSVCMEVIITGPAAPAAVDLSCDGRPVDLVAAEGGLLACLSPEGGEVLRDAKHNMTVKFNPGFDGDSTITARVVDLSGDEVLASADVMIEILPAGGDIDEPENPPVEPLDPPVDDPAEPPGDDIDESPVENSPCDPSESDPLGDFPPDNPDEPGEPPGGGIEEPPVDKPPGEPVDPGEPSDTPGDAGENPQDACDPGNPPEPPGDGQPPGDPGEPAHPPGKDIDGPPVGNPSGDPVGDVPDEPGNPVDPPRSGRSRAAEVRFSIEGDVAVIDAGRLSPVRTGDARLYSITPTILRKVLNSSGTSGLNGIIFDLKNRPAAPGVMAGIRLNRDAVDLIIEKGTDVFLRMGYVTVGLPLADAGPSAPYPDNRPGGHAQIGPVPVNGFYVALQHTGEPYAAGNPDGAAGDGNTMQTLSAPGPGFMMISNITAPALIQAELSGFMQEMDRAGGTLPGIWWGRPDGITEFIRAEGDFPNLRIQAVPAGRFRPGAVPRADSVRG